MAAMSLRACMDPALGDDELSALTGEYRYGRYCEDSSLPLPGSRRLVLDRVREFRSGQEAHCLAAMSRAGTALGILLFKLSRWDSEHFGYPVAVVDSVVVKTLGYDGELEVANVLLEGLNEWCQFAGVRLVSARVSARDLPVIHGLERSGFRFIESWIFNKYDLSRLPEPRVDPNCLRLAHRGDLDLMHEYSRGAFVTQRFHADPRVDPERADSLYRKWISTSFDDPNQRVLALEDTGKPVAFMIYYESDLTTCLSRRFAMWRMALLDPASRGKGVGTEFFTALLYHHREAGFDVVDSGLSMRNLASLHLHNRIGFKVVATLVTFHLWLAPDQAGADSPCGRP